MFGLIRKNAVLSFIYLFIFIPGLYIYWKTSRTALDGTVVFLTTGLMYMVVLGSILMVEFREERLRGRAFLDSLPLLSWEIVGARFMSALINTALYSMYACYMFGALEVSAHFLRMSRIYLFFNTGICLLIAGLCYITLFRFGFDWLGKVMVGIIIISYVSPVAIEELVAPRYAGLLPALTEAAACVSIPLLIAGAVLLYAGLMVFAVKIKEQKYVIH